MKRVSALEEMEMNIRERIIQNPFSILTLSPKEITLDLCKQALL